LYSIIREEWPAPNADLMVGDTERETRSPPGSLNVPGSAA
jgi:hypothetical protein